MTGDSARKLIGRFVGRAKQGITAAANYAMSQPAAAPKYAVIGYCWGGGTVWGYAINGGVNGFSGGVAYYGCRQLPQGHRSVIRSPRFTRR